MRPVVDPDLIRAWSRPRGLRAAVRLVVTLGLLIASFSMLWISPSVAIAAPLVFILNGILFHHLLIIQHETLHYSLFQRRSWNSVVCAITSYLIGLTPSYRKVHLAHHRHLGEAEKDPDLRNYSRDPLTRREFVVLLVANVSGYAAVAQFFRQRRTPGNANVLEVLILAIVHSVILGSFAVLGAYHYYLIFWLLPLATVTKTITNLRNLAEHIDTLQASNSRHRTILCPWWERLVFAPLHFNYHAEHHFYPSVNYTQLPKLHELLMSSSDALEKMEVARSYVGVLHGHIGPRPSRAARADAWVNHPPESGRHAGRLPRTKRAKMRADPGVDQQNSR